MELKPYKMQNLEIAASEKLFLNLEDSDLLKAETMEIRRNKGGSEEKPSRMVLFPDWSLTHSAGCDYISPKVTGLLMFTCKIWSYSVVL